MGRPKSLPLQTARGGAVGGGRPSAGHAGREPEPDRALTSLAGECFSPGTDPPARAHPRPRAGGAASWCRGGHSCRTRLACLHPSWAEGGPAGRGCTVLESAGSLRSGLAKAPAWAGGGLGFPPPSAAFPGRSISWAGLWLAGWGLEVTG